MTFAWATPAVLAGAKTSSRQPWRERTARQYRAGTAVTVYDRLPRRGGRPMGVVRITEEPVLQPLTAMPDSAYEEEGWRWLYEHRDHLPRWLRETDFSWEAFEQWRARPGEVWVVRFRLESVAIDQITEALALAAAA